MTSTFAYEDLEVLCNRTFDEIVVGDLATIQRTLTAADLQLFAAMSGDIAAAQSDAESTQLHGVIAHGMWAAALISAVLGTRLPGPGTSYAGQTLKFHRPVRVGDTLTITVTVKLRQEMTRLVLLDCQCTNQDGEIVISGEATVIAPAERIERPRGTLPQVRVSLQHGDELVRVLQYVKPLGRIRVAVVHPCDEVSLSAALDARTAGVIEPVLIGPRARLEALAQKSGASLREVAIEDVPHSEAAAARGVELALKGEVEALMKGSLHTDELMAAVVKSALRTGRRMSHCFIMQTPAYPRPFIITDAAINIAPTLQDKADIIRNAIDLAHAFGIARPRVAILAAVETINPACRPRWTRRRSARWPTAARSPARSSTARSPSTTPCPRPPRAPRESFPKWPAQPISSWFPISKPATCSRSSSSTSAARRAPASSSARAFRSSSPAARIRARRVSHRAPLP